MKAGLLALTLGLLACGSPVSTEPPPPAAAPPPSPGPQTHASTARAAAYLDGRVAQWLADPPRVANVGCAMNCHTTFPAVLARASLPAESTTNIEKARARFEARLPSAAEAVTPFYGENDDDKVRQSHATESVLVAAALVLDDTARGESLSPQAKEALERMWARQGSDGAWPWLDFGLEPWEHAPMYGVAIAALAAGTVPAGTPHGPAEGIARMKAYVRAHLAGASLHDRTAMLWASSSLDGLLTEEQAQTVADELRSKQRPDGSFALARLMGKRARRKDPPDGYATALATLALCTTGRDGEAVHAGRSWLEQHQRPDGSWPGRSVNTTSRTAERYMTDAATAYAVLARQVCPTRQPDRLP